MQNKKLEYLSVTTIDDLQAHASQWDSLLNRAGQKSPMLSHSWISNHLASFLLSGQTWVCVLGYSGSRLVAVMPLVLSSRRWPISHMVAMSPFGTHLNVGDILHEKDLSESILPGILCFAFSSYPSLGYIELPRVSAESPTLNSWSRQGASTFVSVKERSYGYYLPPQDDFISYEKSLSRNFRKNLSKAKNKLAKLEDCEYEFLGSNSDVTECLLRFSQLERCGWKGRSGTAIAESDAHVRFYTSVLTGLNKAGFLEWHFLKHRDGDLAAHMAFRIRDKIILWKLAYDESHSACSPGSLLMRELVETEVRAGTRSEIDLTTDQVWYSNWNLVPRQYYQVRIFNRKNWLSALYGFFIKTRIAAMKNPMLRHLRVAKRSLFKKLFGK
jgi:CelD/BcsL family acetyltransferase involved in cellulose biosynthesis